MLSLLVVLLPPRGRQGQNNTALIKLNLYLNGGVYKYNIKVNPQGYVYRCMFTFPWRPCIIPTVLLFHLFRFGSNCCSLGGMCHEIRVHRLYLSPLYLLLMEAAGWSVLFVSTSCESRSAPLNAPQPATRPNLPLM